MAEWLTASDVLAWAGEHVTVTVENPAVVMATAAAIAYAESESPQVVIDGNGEAVEEQPASVKLGTAMLAWRLIERRGTALGTAGLGPDFGGAAQIMRSDPDVARLLKVGPFAPFSFGAPTPGGAPNE